MHCLFFKLLEAGPNKTILAEHFFWEWSQNFEKHDNFVLIYYREIGALLDEAVEAANRVPTSCVADFLLRHRPLSQCLDYYDHVVKPAVAQNLINCSTAIRASNQRLLKSYESASKN